LGVQGNPQATIYWERLLALEAHTADDIRAYISLCLDTARPEKAEPYLKNQLNQVQPNSQDYLLGMRYWLAENQPQAVLALAQKALADYPQDESLALLTAQALGTLQPSNWATKIRSTLEPCLASSDPAHYLAAYELLARYDCLTADEKKEIAGKLKADSIAQQDAYRVATLRIALDPQSQPEIIQEVLARIDLNNAEERLQWVRWLNSQKAYASTLTYIPWSMAAKHSHFMVAYLDALAALSQWKMVQEVIFRDDLPLDPFITQLFRTRVSLFLNESDIATAQWRLALALAKRDPSKLAFLAQYFEALGQWDYAWEGYEALAEIPTYTLKVLHKLLHIAQVKQDTTLNLRVLERLHRLVPQDLAPLVGTVYLKLLLGIDTQQATQQALELYQSHPQLSYLRHIAALAHLKAHNPRAALGCYASDYSPDEFTQPAWQVIYACVLAANDRPEAAQLAIRTLELKQLKPEELQLLREHQLLTF
jgi:hypothetical protein